MERAYLCVGVGARQWSGKSCLFLDMDNHTKEQCEQVAKELIGYGGTSDCYIIESSKDNHHLINLDLFNFQTVKHLAVRYAHGDFARIRGQKGDYVLRISPKMEIKDDKLDPVPGTKPKLVGIVKSPFHYRSKSDSLRRLFSRIWGYDIPKDKKFTDSSKVRLHGYRVRMVS